MNEFIHFTSAEQVATYMAGFEKRDRMDGDAFALSRRRRTYLLARVRWGQLHHGSEMDPDTVRALKHAVDNEDAADAIEQAVERAASLHGSPFLDFLKSLNWEELLKIILPILLAFLQKPHN